jgi:group I intron endonuclease
MFLYVITNLVNGKQYVGIANHPERRKVEHFSGHGSKLVRQALRKYGRENLHFEVWYEGPEDWIKMMEYRAIVMLDTRAPYGYNLTLGGEGAPGWRHSDETRRKMSSSRTAERNGMWGKRQSGTTRQVIRQKAIERQRAKPNHAFSVRVHGVVYGTIKEAARALGESYNGLCQRIRRYRQSGEWPEGLGLATRGES